MIETTKTCISIRKIILFIFTIVFVLITPTHADPPIFSSGIVIQNEDEELPGDETGYTAPGFGDWDNDGDLDLMIGTFEDAPIYLFQNVAEDGEPVFELVGNVEADGEIIDGPYG
ncbi:MAG: hypothetical protein P9X24_04185 [Candidatus Hatepunaea meridiana]|nr:hypothetical protein [Candidatus Hatepunaea meridiana]